ncbi:MAG: beta-glucosidase [Chlorobi bacterium]|nr:beta-glucosidase [Chlorobiota bacterium]
MKSFDLKKSFGIFFIILVTSVTYSTLFAQENNEITIYKDVKRTLEERAKDLISRMTLEEKIGLTIGDGRYLNVDEPKLKETGEGIYEPNRNAKLVIPRLSIRQFTHINGPSGVNKGNPPEDDSDFNYTTAFPSATCLAATWDTELIEKVGKVTGNEVLEYDYDLSKMPGLNIHRDPKCGRNFEYYSEDPLLTGKMAAAMIHGLQSNGIGAVIKHFVANNQETNRRTYNAVIGQRTLREIYLRGFEIAVKEGKPASIMTSYNRLNGFYTAENSALLQNIAREEWGFDGLFMTDFDMHYGDAVAQVRAGTNLIMTGAKYEYEQLKFALKNKMIDESTLDKNLYYNIKLKLNAPRMKGFTPSFKPDLENHAKVARESAADGMVLLKNKNNTLPVKDGKTVAVFGKTSYDLILSGTGSGTVDSYKYKININEGLKSAGFKVLKDIENNYTEYIEKLKRENLVPPYFDNPKMRKDNGIKGNQAPSHFKTRLVAFSKEQVISKSDIEKYESNSDFALITLGRSAGENYENGYLPISNIELDLVKNVSDVFHAKGKKVIVVLNVGGVWETASWRDYADAILLAWQPGQEGGNSVADILTGAVNPSGKLPDSFPMKYEDVPSSKSFPGIPAEDPINSFYEEGIYVGYRYYDSFNVPTAYEFGYGLSYTTFDYSDLKLSSTNFSSKMKVTVTVKNTGKVAGKEVAQLYLAAPSTEIEKPVQELKGFAKTKLLKPGESQKLTFELDERSLASFWSGISAWVADKGDYEVRIGASSKDIRLKASFNLPKDIVVEEVHDVLYPNFYMEELSRLK